MKILVTGAAGFVGFHLCHRLLKEGATVVGIDSVNDYYDPALKYGRLKQLGISGNAESSSIFPGFTFYKIDLTDRPGLTALFNTGQFDYVVHLAAQAGVRYSLENPQAYIDSNITGFFNILELCREFKPKHLVFASSSSVYGLNSSIPFSTSHHTDHPVSLYAATKKSNEVMAHSYAHLYGIPCSGLRFFTVYGPWGRPDMAYFSFTKKILANQPIDLFNNGDLKRDFTYIDDIVEGIVKLLPLAPANNPDFDAANPDPSQSSAPYKIYNIGNNSPVKLLDFIQTLEKVLGKEAIKNLKPMQPGDVYVTYADVTSLSEACGFQPSTSLETGLRSFADWYRSFYGEA